MKRLAVAIALAVSTTAFHGCTSLHQPKEKGHSAPSAQARAMALQGKELHPKRQIQRYVAVRWGNTGRGGAAQLQPGYVHVLLGEDDPQGAQPFSYDTALALRDAMERREAEMARLREEQAQARDIRRQQETQELKQLMDTLSVGQSAVGLESGVYATEQPSAEAIAEAVGRARDQARQIERQRFNQTAEDIDRQMASMSELMEKDRWVMACAGYHDLLDEGDYAYLMAYGGPSAIPDDATPNRCPGLFPDEHLVDDLTADMCPGEIGFSAKKRFYSELFELRGIESSIYNPVSDMLEPCLNN